MAANLTMHISKEPPSTEHLFIARYRIATYLDPLFYTPQSTVISNVQI